MTDTIQGGAMPFNAQANTKHVQSPVAHDGDKPPSGINPDMPASIAEAKGEPPGFTWGLDNHK